MTNNRKIKCVVWDLDNTIWDGIILENDNISLRPGVLNIIRELDKRGILQSISSKNDYKAAFNQLKKFKIDEYFIYPQINWNPKSESIKQIAKSINIGIDTLAFIDDQFFERDEVSFAIPEVLCIDSVNLDKLLDMPEMNPRFISDASKIRRKLYMNDIKRNLAEKEFQGTPEEFLKSLGMKLIISPVVKNDLERVEELTVRTHQLNATGYTYSFEELSALRKLDKYKLFIVDLVDKYGVYGKIGLTLIECIEDKWVLKLLLMSCRVMSRGIGAILLNCIERYAKNNNARLFAEFVPTDKNRVMYITYKFAGFKEVYNNDGLTIFEHNLENIQPIPDYIEVELNI